MLSLLRLKNIAIVSELELEFGPGLNIITGETGAGKSVILRGLDLLGGGKVPADIVRHGAERGEIEALFVLPDREKQKLLEILPWTAELLEEDEVILRRTVESSGRGKIAVNGRLTSRAELEELAAEIFEITGQHSAAKLLREGEHRRLLDEFAADRNPSFAALREQAARAYGTYASSRRALEEFEGTKSSREEYLRRIRFEAEELERARLKAGEKAQLSQELERLSGAETLLRVIGEALELLEGDEGVGRQHFRVRQLLERAGKIDSALGETAELIESAAVQFDEARRSLLEYASQLNADPDHLERLRERIAEIARLERKYGRSEADLVDYYAQIRNELSLIERGELDEAALRRSLESAEEALRAAGQKLSAERRKAAAELSAAIERELCQVNMKEARFSVTVGTASASPFGADAVQFMLAANPGQPPCPLDRVASGGELSRVLLLLKSVINETNTTAVQIFDEIDTGIGGAVAQIVGEKIRAIASRNQVILVTHAPQIAALADRHLRVRKEIAKGATDVEVEILNDELRVHEIARMLAGKRISASFEDSARELLRTVRPPAQSRGKRAGGAAHPE